MLPTIPLPGWYLVILAGYARLTSRRDACPCQRRVIRSYPSCRHREHPEGFRVHEATPEEKRQSV